MNCPETLDPPPLPRQPATTQVRSRPPVARAPFCGFCGFCGFARSVVEQKSPESGRFTPRDAAFNHSFSRAHGRLESPSISVRTLEWMRRTARGRRTRCLIGYRSRVAFSWLVMMHNSRCENFGVDGCSALCVRWLVVAKPSFVCGAAGLGQRVWGGEEQRPSGKLACCFLLPSSVSPTTTNLVDLRPKQPTNHSV